MTFDPTSLAIPSTDRLLGLTSFNMPKTPSGSARSISAPSSKPCLLQLAFEIRRNIYTIVLPSKLSIHVQAMWPAWTDTTYGAIKPSTPTALWFLNCGGRLHDSYGDRLETCDKCRFPNHCHGRQSDKRSDSEFARMFDSMAVDLSLLKTCRQVRKEASQLFFGSNRFVFLNEMQCFDLLTLPGLDFSAMRSTTIDLNPYRYQPLHCNLQKDTDVWFDHIREMISKLPGITKLTVYGTMYSEPAGAYSGGEPLPPSDEAFLCTLQMLSKLPLQKASAELMYPSYGEWKEWWDEDKEGNVIFDSDAAKLLLGDWDNLKTELARTFRQRQKLYERVQTELA